MFRSAWFDEDVDLIVELSTSGPLISDDETIPQPFLAGGSNGYPLYWIQTDTSQNARFTVTTDSTLNRWSFSNVAAQGTYNGSATIAVRDFSGIDFANYDYTIQFQARTMEGKDKARLMCFVQETVNGTPVGSEYTLSNAETSIDWVTFATAWPLVNAGANGLRFRWGISGPLAGATANWGGQFANLVFIKRAKVAPAITWRDISCDVRSITTRYGRERFTNRYDVATAQVVVNNIDGEYRYQSPHPFNLRPGRKLRIKAKHAGITYPMFFGVIDTLTDSYAIDGAAVTQITALDPSYVLSNMPTPARQLPTYPNYAKTGARVNALLGIVGWRDKLVDVGQWEVQSIEASGRSVRDEIGVTADSEGGQVFADREGFMVYKDRTWPSTDPNLNQVTATILARPELEEHLTPDPIPDKPGAPTICAYELVTSWSQERTINRVELANVTDTVELYEDKASQKDNGIFTYSRLDFVLYPYLSDANGYLAIRAQDLMAGYSQPVLRVNTVSLRPFLDVASWPWVLSAFLNWMVRIWYANVREDWGYSLVTHVQSVEHQITIDDWRMVLAVDKPEYYNDAPILPSYYWDNSKALWDSATWQV